MGKGDGSGGLATRKLTAKRRCQLERSRSSVARAREVVRIGPGCPSHQKDLKSILLLCLTTYLCTFIHAIKRVRGSLWYILLLLCSREPSTTTAARRRAAPRKI